MIPIARGYGCQRHDACQRGTQPTIWASASPCSLKSDPHRFASEGAWFTTFLTSTRGSMSIRVEGGP
jgi:hypothetical protein